jgi:hypothetical protein
MYVGTDKRLILVIDAAGHNDWAAVQRAIREMLPAHLALEVRDEERLRELTGECFGASIDSFSGSERVSMLASAAPALRGAQCVPTAPSGNETSRSVNA